MTILANTSVQFIKGVGPAKKKLFANLGVDSVEDLLYFFPRRYEDRRNIIPIGKIKAGEWQTISGKVLLQGARRSWYTKKHVCEIVLDDGSGRISCTWFNQPYLEKYFQKDTRIVCYGRVSIYKNKLQMVSPEYEIIDESEGENLNISRIVPIYPLTRGITQRYLRKVVSACLDKYAQDLHDELPVYLRNKYRYKNIKQCIRDLHFPDDFKNQEDALRRISFEEFFFFQISIILRRLSMTQKKGIAHRITDPQALKFVDSFPYELTKAQKRAIREIRQDMQKDQPMLRLLQGDVGCGKTLVALFGCMMAAANGHQAAFMAPTEILARQHYENIVKMMAEGALPTIETALLISGLPKKEHDDLNERIAAGKIQLVIGTHALINTEVQFKKLSFVVIDEQHRFGVRQRALLSEKGVNPDILIMTATPIPRTLCITLYGDLDISIIDELPKNRGQVQTLAFTHEQMAEVYAMIRQRIKDGRQAYVVYPIIEESEKLDLKAAEEMYRHFKNKEFKDFRLGLVHGKMKRQETQQIMQAFKERQLDILVSTTVLEVGVDVANATVMVIEHAERFGLAQLHQLRGRIGRGVHDSVCLLVTEPHTEEGVKRIDAMCKTQDGFKIAQYDLEIRGPGHFFGRHQHGFSELKVANPATQMDILELARQEALVLTKDDPGLQAHDHGMIKKVVAKRYPNYLVNVEAG
ncbi:MAG: ATP-dependent DNA helicase RecG [Candidatus Omnitrophica bacterium]|nr:ATP-dependent DNA helicase RecG [Candidatus Omnitrophota bacterium]